MLLPLANTVAYIRSFYVLKFICRGCFSIYSTYSLINIFFPVYIYTQYSIFDFDIYIYRMILFVINSKYLIYIYIYHISYRVWTFFFLNAARLRTKMMMDFWVLRRSICFSTSG